MFVDVIVTCFNAERFIEESIGSVCNQEGDLISKIIVIDDASTDNSLSIIKKIINDYSRFKFELIINSKNEGSFLSLRKALSKVESEFVAILEGDDLWINKDKLNNQYLHLIHNNQLSGIGGNSRIIDMVGNDINENYSFSNDRLLEVKDVIEIPPFQLSSLMFRKKCLIELPVQFKGTFSNDKLIYSILSDQLPLYYSKEVVAAYRLNEGGITFSAGIQVRYDEHLKFYSLLDKYLDFRFTINIYNSIFRHQLGYLLQCLNKNETLSITNRSIFNSWIKARKYKELFSYKELLYALKLNLWGK